jgi:hypothetical protein
MKKIFLLFVGIMMLSCSSDNNNTSVDSNILVDGAAFTPTSFKVQNGTSNPVGESSLVFSLTKGTLDTASYEALNFTVKFPTTSSSAPNGTYEFGIGEIATTLFANGSYAKGTNYYSLAGYSVKVTALGGNKYKLEFQNIEAVSMPISGTTKIISGYCEGDFN